MISKGVIYILGTIMVTSGTCPYDLIALLTFKDIGCHGAFLRSSYILGAFKAQITSIYLYLFLKWAKTTVISLYQFGYVLTFRQKAVMGPTSDL